MIYIVRDFIKNLEDSKTFKLKFYNFITKAGMNSFNEITRLCNLSKEWIATKMIVEYSNEVYVE